MQNAMTHQQALDGLASGRYLLDEMTEVERFEFEEHYFGCAECAEDVKLGDMIRQKARRDGAAMAPTPGWVALPLS
ncbi:MAG TPA: zf-HC2 domain-containing protein [Vicinamibacterales bacterium]|nr:zf-HC2 domain-containing protein [Vicinamibacterales bacterium]